MSKPLYMQVSDLQDKLNRAMAHNRNLREELAEARADKEHLVAKYVAEEGRADIAEAARREGEITIDTLEDLIRQHKEEVDETYREKCAAEEAKAAAEADAARYAEIVEFVAKEPSMRYWFPHIVHRAKDALVAAAVGGRVGELDAFWQFHIEVGLLLDGLPEDLKPTVGEQAVKVLNLWANLRKGRDA